MGQWPNFVDFRHEVLIVGLDSLNGLDMLGAWNGYQILQSSLVRCKDLDGKKEYLVEPNIVLAIGCGNTKSNQSNLMEYDVV